MFFMQWSSYFSNLITLSNNYKLCVIYNVIQSKFLTFSCLSQFFLSVHGDRILWFLLTRFLLMTSTLVVSILSSHCWRCWTKNPVLFMESGHLIKKYIVSTFEFFQRETEMDEPRQRKHMLENRCKVRLLSQTKTLLPLPVAFFFLCPISHATAVITLWHIALPIIGSITNPAAVWSIKKKV